MAIDWSKVKKVTLWHYEELIKKLLEVLNHDFVQAYYNHTMAEAAAYSENLQQGYLQHGREADFIREITEHFKKLDDLGVKEYQHLLLQVETKAKCEAFLEETGFSFDGLIQVLNFLLRWILPFRCPIKELVDMIVWIKSLAPI